jgi:hypothetical protein
MGAPKGRVPWNKMTRERFMQRVTIDAHGCWLWPLLRWDGYGSTTVKIDDRLEHLAHRVSWFLFSGSLPPADMELDHLCRVRSCVNPDHLEVVTPQENVRRSESITAENARKTHCHNGHEFTAENTIIDYPNGKQRRTCRACGRAATDRYIARRKAAGTWTFNPTVKRYT